MVPKWTTQAWFPVLVSMLISHPREIRPHKQLLTLPLAPDSFHPLHKKLVLLAVHLSGTRCKVLAYQHRLQSLSATHGDQVLEYNTIRSCEGGEGFVLGDRYIPLLPLLSDMYEKGLAYNTIAAAKSVLPSIIHLPGVVSISDHPLVERLLKGFFNTRPSTSKYPYIWDTSKLDYLRSLQNDRNDFATMSKKLVALFTLLSGQRVNTLHKFKRSMMQVLPDGTIFHLSGNLKQSQPANPPEPIIFHQYPHDGELCPVAAFHQYHLTRTAIFGNQFDDSIFLCHRKPNAPATIDTLARWVKQSMIAAGIDTTIFHPHSCRAASTSKANAAGVPLHQILRAGQWSQESTFFRFYCKQIITSDLTNVQFANALLN